MKTTTFFWTSFIPAWLVLGSSFAPAAVFTNDAVISPANRLYDGQDIVISNCIVAVDGTHIFANLEVGSGGVLTHSQTSMGTLPTTVLVTNEAHVLSATNAEATVQAALDLSTLTVRDESGMVLYTNGVDYSAMLTNDRAWILLLPGSSIAEGSTNLVDYLAPGAGVPTGLELVVTGRVDVAAGGEINGDAKGFPAASGPGKGVTGGSPSVGTGASYGGLGGGTNMNPNAVVYGDFVSPADLGSGGGNGGNANTGGLGGGRISLEIAGALRVDGRISANGSNSPGARGGGGSGGSIRLKAQIIAGAGRILSKGGNGDPGQGGGGGGGRISMECATNLFVGEADASGGYGLHPGGPGSIYTRLPGANTGTLLFDNRDMPGKTALLSGSPCDLKLLRGTVVTSHKMTSGVGNLLVGANAWLNVTNELRVATNAVIEFGGGINVDGLGYVASQGPGAGRTGYSPVGGFYPGSGGGYGGFGGDVSSGAGGGGYGSALRPTERGSGGGRAGSPISPYGSGGGTVRLSVGGLLVCNGVISASGLPGLGGASGGGAGGSIWLTVGTLAGNGLIAADGGDGDGLGLYAGGGGGGGRICVERNLNVFLGRISARGGVGGMYGGAGTIVTKSQGSSNLPGLLVFDNGGKQGAVTSWPSDTYVSLDLAVMRGAIAVCPFATLNGVTIGEGAWMVFTNHTLTVSKNLTVEAGGGLVATGTGSRAESGSGAGRMQTAFNSAPAGSGGGYGGYGSQPYGASQINGGGAYGNLNSPRDAGSGGGMQNYGGAGGGSMTLRVTGGLTVDGVITADGNPGGAPGAGGGSGGTVSIQAGALLGSGTISANGGDGNGLGGGGGGGRILVNAPTNSFNGVISAYGGLAQAVAGGAGTILITYTKGPFDVIIDNGGRTGTNTPVNGLSSLSSLSIGRGAVALIPPVNTTISNLNVDAGGKLLFLPDSNKATLSVLGSAIVRSNGIVSADASGYNFASGPGRGVGGSGAGYGGAGGASSTMPGGSAYGFAVQPTDPGSGGGIGYAVSGPPAGSRGGGALRMIVGGVCSVDGIISASGGDGMADFWGGGSGGSIWLDAGAVTGKGVIKAEGGRGELFLGGGGAGGRIAIYSPADFFAGLISVAGGAGYQYGQDGTIYRATAPLPLEILSYSPFGTVTQAVTSVVLRLNTPVKPESLSPADAIVTTPNGVIAESNIIAEVESAANIRISFPEQSEQGVYTVVLGPAVQNLHQQSMPQAYTAQFQIVWATVEGYVRTPAGQPVPGVVIASSSEQTVTTDDLGHYVVQLPPAGAIEIVPFKQDLSFNPSERTYTYLTSPWTAQDFVAVPATVLAPRMDVGGTMKLSWQAAAGLSYQTLVSTNLVDWEPAGQPIQATEDGPMMIELPTDNSPGKFFRIQTLY